MSGPGVDVDALPIEVAVVPDEIDGHLIATGHQTAPDLDRFIPFPHRYGHRARIAEPGEAVGPGIDGPVLRQKDGHFVPEFGRRLRERSHNVREAADPCKGRDLRGCHQYPQALISSLKTSTSRRYLAASSGGTGLM